MTDTEQSEDGGGTVRPFAATLQDINNGDVADQLSTDMQTLVAAVRELGRKGSITLKVEVAPRRGNASALNVTARVETKLPAPEPVESVFFADDDGNLSRTDPRQMQFDLRTVPKNEPGDLRRAGQ